MSSLTTDSLPEGSPDDPLTGHNYDGIQEYDNPLPGWWKWLFVGSILFSPPYFFFYHSGVESRTLAARYDRKLGEKLREQFAAIGELNEDRETVVKYLYEPSWLQVGKAVFKANCVSCHGQDGGGLVGPNLCDDAYKNVKDIGDILTVLQKGAAGGAMPAWKNRLSSNELVLTASYVASLRGTEPASPKTPEGRAIPPWPEAPPEEESEDEASSGDDESGDSESDDSGQAEGARADDEAESSADEPTPDVSETG
jgi:cytochrome c oxidase cbb3-type subunit 3